MKKSRSFVLTRCPTFTITSTTIPASGVPTEMFSVSSSTIPAPATVFLNGLSAGCTGGGSLGTRSFAFARYCTEKPIMQIAMIGRPNFVNRLRNLETIFNFHLSRGDKCWASFWLPFNGNNVTIIHAREHVGEFKNTAVVRDDHHRPVAFDRDRAEQ